MLTYLQLLVTSEVKEVVMDRTCGWNWVNVGWYTELLWGNWKTEMKMEGGCK